MGSFTLVRSSLIGAAGVLFATGALADAIDGEWCSTDGARSFLIAGPKIETSGGIATTGDYSRHAFTYVVPEGHQDSGVHIDMRLLNELEVQVTEGAAKPEIWHRCKPIV